MSQRDIYSYSTTIVVYISTNCGLKFNTLDEFDVSTWLHSMTQMLCPALYPETVSSWTLVLMPFSVLNRRTKNGSWISCEIDNAISILRVYVLCSRRRADERTRGRPFTTQNSTLRLFQPPNEQTQCCLIHFSRKFEARCLSNALHYSTEYMYLSLGA